MNLTEPIDSVDSIVKKEIRTARGARDESEKPRRGAFVRRSPGAGEPLDRAAFGRVYVLPNGFAEDVGFDGRGYNRCGLHGRLQKRIVRELSFEHQVENFFKGDRFSVSAVRSV
jgi:hypothetical protein